MKAIKEIYLGNPVLNPSIIKKLIYEVQQHNEDEMVVSQLTNRELEILRLVALGKPYKVIAQELSVQQATVRAHVSNMLSKLNLSNRSQLVLYAFNKKIIGQN